MSNPGVLELARKKLCNGTWFRVEDNLGESIHLHYDDFRVDLTINDYLALCEEVEKSLVDLIDIEGFCLKHYDPAFLDTIYPFLKDLKYCTYEKIKLSELKVQVEGVFRLPTLKNLSCSRVVRALEGDLDELNRYSQENDIFENNYERVKKIDELIRNNGYPYDEKYIVLFNSENNIRDGQHRAACLYRIFGSDYEVPIIRMHFKNDLYNTSKFLKFNYLKSAGYKFAKKVYKYIKAIMRRKRDKAKSFGGDNK